MKKYLIAISAALGLIALVFWQGKSFGKNQAENECKAETIIEKQIIIETKENVIQTKIFQQDISNKPTDIEYRIKWLRLIENY